MTTALLSMHDESKASIVANEVAKQLGKDHPSALVLQASVFSQMPDQLEAGLKLLATALEKDPTNVDAAIGMSVIYRKKTEVDKAREVFDSNQILPT